MFFCDSAFQYFHETNNRLFLGVHKNMNCAFPLMMEAEKRCKKGWSFKKEWLKPAT